MSTVQVVVHYVFISWFAWSTFCRMTMINKKFHWTVRAAMALLGMGAVAAFFVPTYLWACGESWESMSDQMLWVYIGLLISGAIAQTAFAPFWITKQAQKIYTQTNVTSILLEEAIRRRRA